MLWMKVLPILLEKPPILFIILLVVNNTKGVPMPSPMAPKRPKIMRNQSKPSACMKIGECLSASMTSQAASGEKILELQNESISKII